MSDEGMVLERRADERAGAYLARLIEARGLKRTWLARQLDCSYDELQNRIHGRQKRGFRRPEREVLGRIFAVSPSLFADEPEVAA